MTHSGPFQPLLFCDSVINLDIHAPKTPRARKVSGQVLNKRTEVVNENSNRADKSNLSYASPLFSVCKNN